MHARSDKTRASLGRLDYDSMQGQIFCQTSGFNWLKQHPYFDLTFIAALEVSIDFRDYH